MKNKGNQKHLHYYHAKGGYMGKELDKCDSSDISLQEFLNNVGVQRLSKSQLSWKKVE